MSEQMQQQPDDSDRPNGSRGGTQAPTVVIHLLREGDTAPLDWPSTGALARLLVQAGRINQSYETEFDATFSSMLLAFLVSDDPLSVWFQGYVREARVAVEELLERRNLDEKGLEDIAARPIPPEELEETHRQTRSAAELFRAARDLRTEVDPKVPPAPLDVRHLMAAYIYRPAGHERDLDSLRYDRPAWSNGFLEQIARDYPGELERWKEVHRQTFSEPITVLTEGPSTHIATDIWTLNDTLGYRTYAYAIYRFMTHPQTRPPLTISIQAPWGGGKTSLMRMIQQALDPTALPDASHEARQPRGDLTIEQALGEVKGRIQEDTERKLPPVPEEEHREMLTVWFNAWKYENTREVWAGLVDAIMHQVAARLTVVERERFWLRLNLKRIDADKIRHRIYERVVRYWWREIRGWGAALAVFLIGSLTIVFTGSLTGELVARMAGLGGVSVTTVVAAVGAVWKWRGAKQTVAQEPAVVSLGDYLDIPDYGTELGYIHRVEADLRRVLDSVFESVPDSAPERYRSIVIFIDDLDRCSPEKVAQVVEAVNLFLGGEFPNCMFVMGMDSEMVAAALQAAHQDMIACLPADAGIPVGWRFMDKFVQLPFLIPPVAAGGMTRYTTALFSTTNDPVTDPEAERLAREAADRISTRAAVPAEAERLREQHNLTESQSEFLQDQLEAQVVRRRLDEGIDTFSDKNPEIRRVITAATDYFSGNPRELKRFINAFRLHYFLWWADRAQGIEGPTLDQLRRWTVLSMKWPEVVRWLRRSGGSDWRAPEAGIDKEAPTVSTRLKLLEKVSGEATDMVSWQQRAHEILRLTPEETPWLNDDDLLRFFYEEVNEYPEGQRLSDGIGKGLW